MSKINIHHLIKSYGLKGKKTIANNDISLEVSGGSIVWIYGNSGSGKSTFLNSITGVDKIDSGEIFYDRFNLSAASEKEKSYFRLNNCGLVFQFFELIKNQNAYTNAGILLKLLHKSKKEINKKLSELFEMFKMSDFEKKKPSELSGGEKQRVAIIRALSNDPLYFFADEITASLDEAMSNYVYDTIKRRLKLKNGIGIFVSHDPIIKSYADEIYKMNEGSLVREY